MTPSSQDPCGIRNFWMVRGQRSALSFQFIVPSLKGFADSRKLMAVCTNQEMDISRSAVISTKHLQLKEIVGYLLSTETRGDPCWNL
jgi:hypothetical protein